MDRRAFLRRAALVASGAIAADQLELLDRLGWVRRLFTTGGWVSPWSGPVTAGPPFTAKMLDKMLREVYSSADIEVPTGFGRQLWYRTVPISGQHFEYDNGVLRPIADG